MPLELTAEQQREILEQFLNIRRTGPVTERLAQMLTATADLLAACKQEVRECPGCQKNDCFRHEFMRSSIARAETIRT